MIVRELSDLTATRVRWLCEASRETALAFCENASADDPVEAHCARLCMHFVAGVPLPSGYALEILRSSRFQAGHNVYLAPLEGHVLAMAMYAVDLRAAEVELAEVCGRNNRELERAAIFRFSRSPESLDDDQLYELSFSDNEDVRRAVAYILEGRQSPRRNEILIRLLDDPSHSVSDAASWVAGQIGEPELADVLVSRGLLFSLSFAGDPRARPRVESLIDDVDSLSSEETVVITIALGDRTLLAKLLTHQEWGVRSDAILASAINGVLDDSDLDGLLATEPVEHLAELATRWPQSAEASLHRVVRRLCQLGEGFPSADALAAGQPVAVECMRGFAATAPKLCGAAIRLLPRDVAISFACELLTSPHVGARGVAARVVGYRGLAECFPLVAELCLDPDANVAEEAEDAVVWGHARCGLYGLDTAILRAGSDFSAAGSPRTGLPRLIEAIWNPTPA